MLNRNVSFLYLKGESETDQKRRGTMKTNHWRWVVVMVMAVFGFAFSASGEEGVTDTEIHIGQWGPQTGPAAPWGAVARGTDAYFKMINDEGGIHGRKIVHHYFDDAYNPAKTKAGVKELQESSHGIFAWVSGVGSAPGMAVKEYLMERQVPWISPSAGSLAWLEPPQKYLFAVYPLYIVEAMALTKYAVETMGFKKIAMVFQNDEYGRNGAKGMRMQLAEYGLELVETVPWNITDNDLKPHVNTLKRSGAEVVLLWTTPTAVVRALMTAQAMQYFPQWMSTSTCSDLPFMYTITRGLFKDVIVTSFGALIDSDDPLLSKYKRDAFEKHAARDERWGTFYVAGMGYAEPLVEALRRVGRDLTREKLVTELEQMRDFQGILGKVNFKPFDPTDPSTRQGQTSVFIVQCLEDAKAKKLTDWITPNYNYH
jgi:branched-chain amino acid transport system substrate-binding protein